MAIGQRDVRLYNLAMRAAEDSDMPDRHGAVIAQGGNVLSIAVNRPGTTLGTSFISAHAEERAIKRLGKRAAGKVLYSARDHAKPTSRPCDTCMQLVLSAGIKRIVFCVGDPEMHFGLAEQTYDV